MTCAHAPNAAAPASSIAAKANGQINALNIRELSFTTKQASNCRQKETDLKNDAAPKPRMPSVTPATNHRGRCHDGRRHHGRRHDNWGRRCNYDWPVRATMSIRTTVKAGTTSALSAGTINTDK